MASKQKQEMCNSCQDHPEKIQPLKNAQMFKAVSDKPLDCLKVAIEAGADVNEYDEPTGDMKICLDCYGLDGYVEYYKILGSLSKAGVDINDPPQQTALICTVENHWLEGVELLIESGADVNKCDTTLKSPLSIAREHGSEELEPNVEASGSRRRHGTL